MTARQALWLGHVPMGPGEGGGQVEGGEAERGGEAPDQALGEPGLARPVEHL